ncbi:MAG: tRNA (N(6)-L-threonylcarbamoyladenosine(37)-C(2))-methylthiotransferase MtaB, partial [Aliarcobacter sp.]
MKFSTNRPKVFFKTFGCRTNIFDTQVMISNLKDFDVTQDESEANIVVINSCTVTNSADTTARS